MVKRKRREGDKSLMVVVGGGGVNCLHLRFIMVTLPSRFNKVSEPVDVHSETGPIRFTSLHCGLYYKSKRSCINTLLPEYRDLH